MNLVSRKQLLPYLVKNHEIVQDQWTIFDSVPNQLPSKAIVPLTDSINTDQCGVWVENDVELDEVYPSLIQRPLVAVNFPSFPDGRGLTIGHLLRNRYQYKNELRAIGAVTPDLVPFMYRCGFDSFCLPSREEARTTLKCLAFVTHEYQSSVIQELPKFRTQTDL